MDLEHEPQIYYLKYIKSQDNGKSWSPPVDQWHKDFKFITSGRGIQTRKGTLLHTLVNLDQNFGAIKLAIPYGDESKVVELSDGSWMVNSRLNREGYRQTYISSDEGKTWASRPDQSLVDPGSPATVQKNQRLEFYYLAAQNTVQMMGKAGSQRLENADLGIVLKKNN